MPRSLRSAVPLPGRNSGSSPRQVDRFLGCAEDHSALVRQASLLLGGDFAAAGPSCRIHSLPSGTRGAGWATSRKRACTCARRSWADRGPVVGTLRTLAAAAKVVEALGLAIDLAEVGTES